MLTDQLPSTALGVLLDAANDAPVLHVPRAWRIDVGGHLLDIRLDGSTPSDPVARIQRIATGAAVFNLRCAAGSLGYDSWVSLYPYPSEPALAARILVEPTDLPDPELRQLYTALQSRRPAREATLPDQQARRMLERAAAIEDAQLTWLPIGSLATVVTHGGEPGDQVRAGIALERVLLTATSRDVRAECLNYTLIRFGEPTTNGRSS
jgi:hypothetical protein